MLDVYKNIRFLRMKRGLCQEQMAQKMNIVVSGYGKVERGKTQLTIERLYEIAKVLKVKPTVLLEMNTQEWTEISEIEYKIYDLMNSESVKYSRPITFDEFIKDYMWFAKSIIEEDTLAYKMDSNYEPVYSMGIFRRIKDLSKSDLDKYLNDIGNFKEITEIIYHPEVIDEENEFICFKNVIRQPDILFAFESKVSKSLPFYNYWQRYIRETGD